VSGRQPGRVTMNVALVRERLRDHRPAVVEGPGYARAAVAIVLRDADHGAEFVVIHRAHRRGDPWSGHMALPGGRQDAADRDLPATAVRETREEVGLDLALHGELLGALDDVQAIGHGRPLDLIITPFVYTLTAPATLTPNHQEVQSALFVPLDSLRRHDARGTHRQEQFGHQMEFPAYVYKGHTIWGLTHRILTGLLDVLS
jgi:8-oxo-dGTP pyrophosphatase MutT (NUDIX family)